MATKAKCLMKLQLGCGPGKTPEGWINLDGSWNARLSKYPTLRTVLKAIHFLPASLLELPWSADIVIHDLRKSLPFPDDSFCAVYGSHVLEHLYLEQAKRLLKECLRVLQPGGVLRLVVPDLQAIVREYRGEISFGNTAEMLEKISRADVLNTRLHFRTTEPPSGNFIYRIPTALNDFHSHKWMYDSESLCLYFRSAGFVEVDEMKFQQSRIDGIEAVEQAGRVLNGQGICVEGIKVHQ